MRLEAYCKNCNSPIAFNTFEETRADFAKNKGKILLIKCKKCNIEAQHHINEFTAKSYILRIISYCVLVVGYGLMAIPFVFPEYYEIIYTMLTGSKGQIVIFGLLPSTIFVLVQNTAKRKEKVYNTYRVKQ